jgi:2',5'-phosphodiesterase
MLSYLFLFFLFLWKIVSIFFRIVCKIVYKTFCIIFGLKKSYEEEIFNRNFLASAFGSPQYFKCDEKLLSFEYRMPLIKENVEKGIKNKAIITLQEVDELIFDGLRQSFGTEYHTKCEFYLVKTNTIGDQSQGVLIGVPKSKYDVLDEYKCTLSNEIFQPENVQLNLPPEEHVPKAKGRSVYEMAKRDNNVLIGLLVKHKKTGKMFWIFNYHIPCIWWWMAVMTLQIDVLKKKMLEISNGLPFIFCSDTNAKKRFPDRMFLEKGFVDESILPYKGWTPSKNSTYLLRDSMISEGSPTTRCKPAGSASDLKNGEFFENLDGIFHFGFDNIAEVKSVVASSLESCCPNETEPSDHALLIGTITFE